MYDTVTVALDGTDYAERALPVAARVAEQFAARLVVTSVVLHEASDERRAVLESAVARHGIDAQIELVDGIGLPALRLAQLIERRPGDTLVCMASHSRGRISQVALGSMTIDLIHELNGPVLLVGPASEEGDLAGGADIASLIVPVDGSALSASIVPTAIAWARTLSVPVHLVSVVVPMPIEYGEPDTDGDGSFYRTTMGGIADSLLAQGIEATWGIVYDFDPAAAIVAVAADRPHSIVVMSTHGRGGLASAVLGSTMREVVHAAPCPVLVLHPVDPDQAQ